MANILLNTKMLDSRSLAADSSAGSGFDEQWQRALEKAYFEKQVEVMRSVGPLVDSEVVPDILTAPETLSVFSQEGAPVPGQAISAISVPDGAIFQLTPEGACSLPANLVNRLSQLQTLQGAAPEDSGWQQINTMQRANSALPSRIAFPQLQGFLPPTSSIRTVVSEDGVYVIIRDSSLQKADILNLLGEIRNFLAGENQRLLGITLNGRLVWEDIKHPSEVEGQVYSEHKINRLF